MRGAAGGAHDDAERSLRSARELAFGRFAVDEEFARRLETIRGARTVGAFLFPDDKQEIDALFAGLRQVVGGNEHGGGDALRIACAATVEAIAVESRRDVGWHRVEVRRERDAASVSLGPHVRAPP